MFFLFFLFILFPNKTQSCGVQSFSCFGTTTGSSLTSSTWDDIDMRLLINPPNTNPYWESFYKSIGLISDFGCDNFGIGNTDWYSEVKCTNHTYAIAFKATGLNGWQLKTIYFEDKIIGTDVWIGLNDYSYVVIDFNGNILTDQESWIPTFTLSPTITTTLAQQQTTNNIPTKYPTYSNYTQQYTTLEKQENNEKSLNLKPLIIVLIIFGCLIFCLCIIMIILYGIKIFLKDKKIIINSIEQSSENGIHSIKKKIEIVSDKEGDGNINGVRNGNGSTIEGDGMITKQNTDGLLEMSPKLGDNNNQSIIVDNNNDSNDEMYDEVGTNIDTDTNIGSIGNSEFQNIDVGDDV